MQRVEVRLAGRPVLPGQTHLCSPHSAWAAGLPRCERPGQEPLRPPSLLCSTQGLSHPSGCGLALVALGSLLYIFETSFYSL